MEKTEQLKKVWEDNFGEEYTKRKLEVHETEGNLRDTFWKELVQMVPDASTYLEIGCNAGMNLISLHNASTDIKLTGLEPNDFAFNTAVGQGEAAPFTVEQRLTQLLLHVADHLADGGLGDEQLLGGAGEALLPHQLDEVTQGSNIHDALLTGMAG